LVLPLVRRSQLKPLLEQLRQAGITRRHRLLVKKAPPVGEIMGRFGLAPPETMGRGYKQDPLFFQAVGAAALAAAEKVKKSND
jgi:hypothetical protein